jgi:hypothetical protein
MAAYCESQLNRRGGEKLFRRGWRNGEISFNMKAVGNMAGW